MRQKRLKWEAGTFDYGGLLNQPFKPSYTAKRAPNPVGDCRNVLPPGRFRQNNREIGMMRAIRLFAALAALGCMAGCSSSKPSRKPDSAGGESKVTIPASLPAGNYAGVADVSGWFATQSEGQSEVRRDLASRMEMALAVRQSGARKTGTISITRMKMTMMGVEVDTNAPPSDPSESLVPPNEPQDKARVLRQSMGTLIGPKIEWEFLPDGRVGPVVRNDFATAGDKPAKTLGEAFDPQELADTFGIGCPKEPVGVGAVWHIAHERQIPGISQRMPLDTEYELIDLQDSPFGKTATIKFCSKRCSDVNATRNGVTVRSVDFTVQGQMHVDVKSGLQLDNVSTLSGTLDMEVQGRKVKVSMKFTIAYSAKSER